MKLSTTTSILTLLLSASSAQLLTNGNSQFPSCAASCQLLNQAAQACGGTASATQAIWSCFCQSGYLTSLYSSPNGICDAYCTNPSDNQQVMTWYKSNCGSDFGASEHADSGSSDGAVTTVVVTSTSTSAAATSATSTSAASASSNANTGATSTVANGGDDGNWFQSHWKWVVMLIVLFVALILLALLATWLKRRHDRKADQIREGFNAGITSRSAPTMSTVNNSTIMADTSTSQHMAGGLPGGSGRNSPVPFGYYTRSESRLSGRADLEGRRSPLARVETPSVDDIEKVAGSQAKEMAVPGKTRRVLVRERSMVGPESPGAQKEMR